MKRAIQVTVGIWLLAAVPVGALFVALYATGHREHVPWVRFLVETFLFLGVMLAIGCLPAVRELLMGLDRRRSVLLAALFCGLLSGQLFSQSRLTFPFLGWDMYTTRNENVTVLEFDAVYESGKPAPYPFAEVCPTRFHRPFMDRFNISVPKPEDPSSAKLMEKNSKSLQALVRQFNAQATDDPIVSLCLSRAVFQAELFRAEDWVRRERLLCVEAERP